MTTKKSIYIIILAIVSIGIFMFASDKKDRVVEQDTATLKVEKTEVVQNRLPESFPSDFPMEEQAMIIQNYNATASDGRFQATRVFTTIKTLQENYDLYEKFLKENSWKILTIVDQPNFKTLSASKENALVHITISENSIDKLKTVDITYTTEKQI